MKFAVVTGIAGGLVLASASGAFAQCGSNFAGFYIGANAGFASHTSDTVEREAVGLSLFNNTETGGTVGAQIGYNWQLCRAVFGIEADWNWADVESSRSYDIAGLVAPPLFEDRRDIRWFGTLRTKAGIAVDNTLLYITGGLAWADIRHSLDVPVAALNVFNFSDTRFGWTVGGGVEFKLASNVSLKSEVLYLQFEGKDRTIDPFVGFPIQFEDRDSMWVGRIGLNFSFGPSEVREVPLK